VERIIKILSDWGGQESRAEERRADNMSCHSREIKREGGVEDLIESNIINFHFSWKVFTILHSFRKRALAVYERTITKSLWQRRKGGRDQGSCSRSNGNICRKC
jgi:hypothetical protein